MRVLALFLGAILILLALLHVRWAIGGSAQGVAVPSRPDGSPLFRPSPFASLSVAGALAFAAALVLAHGGVLQLFAPRRWIALGTWGVALAFAARTIGEFRYVGLFRRVHDTPFARWDARLFTPLCALLAVGTAWLAAS